ncbi:hypothetical protein KIH87_08550 [Paraneptunicella aestuarii]|uniref:type III-B CRISPR module-associated protein Cmr5 n=1 Tax=Paraneptunicella aestuarii TaxID=2831148 RepID=UPI001E382E39|nr:type III-B CRISPR module-associated protein Cmr5 [Paraneptunicella aestuarii]UAA40368.1 hypothetical protein KIH87_08550 [Paraneptunicella aestuarii]
MQLESQQFAETVFKWLESDDIREIGVKRINNRVKAVPAMLQNNGLMMTLVTLEASSDKCDKKIGRFICEYLHDERLASAASGEANTNDVANKATSDNALLLDKTITQLQALTLTRYFFAQTKTAQLVNWVKQISQAKKELSEATKQEKQDSADAATADTETGDAG